MNAMIKEPKVTKARSMAQRRKGGRAMKPGPRHPGGKLVQPSKAQKSEDAQLSNLMARCRIAGLPPTPENLNKMKAQYMGCSAGRAIAAYTTNEATRAVLFAAAQHFRRVVLSHDRAIGAPNRHAKCAGILAPTDAMEASAESPPLDDRTDAEKQRGATSALMAVHGWLGYVDAVSASVTSQACINDPERDVRNIAGLVAGLTCIADGIAGRKMVWRGNA